MIDPNDPGTANIIIAIIGVVFAMIISFILTFVMFKDETAEVETPKSGLNKRHVMSSPMSGEVISIKEVKDEAFSQEVLGRGIGIRPSTGELVAPFDGKVVTLFPTKHAVGLVSDEGMEVLIHIGFNTVRLKGKHFEAFVQEGDTVQKGQRLVTFNIEEIEKAGFSVETPMIVTNTDSYLEIIETQESKVNAGEVLLTGLL